MNMVTEMYTSEEHKSTLLNEKLRPTNSDQGDTLDCQVE